MRRGMDEMLNPVYRDRRFRVRDIEDALHPQHLVAMAVKQREREVVTGIGITADQPRRNQRST